MDQCAQQQRYSFVQQCTINGIAPTLLIDIAPTLLTHNPVDAASAVANTSSIHFSFSEPVDLTATAISLNCPMNINFTGLPAHNVSSITLIPSTDLPSLSTCTVTVHTDQISDSALNTLANTPSFNFTTAALNLAPLATAVDITRSALGKRSQAFIIITILNRILKVHPVFDGLLRRHKIVRQRLRSRARPLPLIP